MVSEKKGYRVRQKRGQEKKALAITLHKKYLSSKQFSSLCIFDMQIENFH